MNPSKVPSVPPDVFWGEMAPCEHFVQLYEKEAECIDALADFIRGGLDAGEVAVVIARPQYRDMLETRLTAAGVDVTAATWAGDYFPLDAEKMLADFMVDGWPDQQRFNATVRHVIGQARRDQRKLRVFGEMVALLWAQGNSGATVRLEHLWNDLLQDESMKLFCAYPKAGFTRDAQQSIAEICAAHTRVIAAEGG